jgi:hypothetical protein
MKRNKAVRIAALSLFLPKPAHPLYIYTAIWKDTVFAGKKEIQLFNVSVSVWLPAVPSGSSTDFPSSTFTGVPSSVALFTPYPSHEYIPDVETAAVVEASVQTSALP